MTASNRDHGRNVGALALIGLGVLFLVGQVFGFNIGSLFNFAWPFFIIIPGVLILFAALTGGKSLSGLAIPGMVITGTGLILFFQSTFNYFESWAYAWALYPGFVGAGMLIMGLQRADRRQVEVGQNMMRGALAGFVLFGAFFELFIFHRISGMSHVLLPLLLIGGGVFLLLGRGRMGMRPSHDLWGHWDSMDKPKNDQTVVNEFANGDKPKNGDYRPKWDLNRRIEEAIREDGPKDPDGFV